MERQALTATQSFGSGSSWNNRIQILEAFQNFVVTDFFKYQKKVGIFFDPDPVGTSGSGSKKPFKICDHYFFFIKKKEEVGNEGKQIYYFLGGIQFFLEEKIRIWFVSDRLRCSRNQTKLTK